MIILEEEEGGGGEDVEDTEVENYRSLQLSLNPMAGLTSTKSWKVGGNFKDRRLWF